MPDLPPPEVYEKEFQYMPWGKLTDDILTYVAENTPRRGLLVDLMCGPGHLAGRVAKARPDLFIRGIDNNGEFIKHARRLYGREWSIFEQADVRRWNTRGEDVVLCTAGLHHLPYDQQEGLVARIAGMLKPRGFAICADPYVDDYTDETQRKVAAARLGYEYLIATIRNGATPDVIDATIDILENDVKGIEFKTSVKRMRPVFERHFSQVIERKTWPDAPSEYGDYIFILRK